MKKSIFLFFAAILCATSAWAGPSFSGGCVYFHNKGGWNDTYKYICISHDSWTEPRTATVIANTQLWYNALPTSGWTDAKYMSAMGHSSSKSASNFKVSSCNHYTANVSLGNWGFNNGNAQMLTPASGSNNANLTLTYVGSSYTSMNKTITVKAKVSTNNGATYSEATSPGTLSASSYAFTSYTSCKSAKSLSSGKITCGYTANTTLTAADADGYTFDGWYNASGTKQTADKTLSINPTADATYYAYYTREALAEETHDVTISYMCGSTSIKENKTETGVGISTPSEISAPAIDGYKFDSWSFGTGVQSTDAETANPIDITTKTSGIYTLTANYSELPKETVYFINTPKWTGTINAYAWTDGTPKVENAGWAGLPAKKEDFQIGEYEVYSYTATAGKYANVIFNGSGGQTADLTWQAGKYYAPSKGKWYDTKEAATEALATPLADETVYFVNNKQWASVAIYGWGGTLTDGTGANKWPGAAMTKTAEQVAGFDVYSYTAKEGTLKNILFNHNGDANKTSDFVWTNGKYYYMGAAENYTGGTKEEVAVLVTPDPLATEVYLAGDMTNKDNWDVNKKEFRKAAADATNASVTVTLTAQTYKFKLVIDGAWKGNTGTMQRGGNAVHEGGWSFEKDGYDDNCQIVADIAGDYTFTWDLTTKKLTVAYPPLPKYTVTATAENGSVTGAGEYDHGSEATLVATPNAGYAFKNWTKDGEEVSTEATYTFTVTANVELVANFVPEQTHEVTVSYLCNTTPIPGQTTQTLPVGVTTPSTITAPTIKNYKFDSWTLGTGVQSEDATTANPIQITTLASGEYTLAANYTKIELTYTVEVPAGTEKCFIRGAFDGWDKFHEMELKDGETNVFTLTIDGAVETDEYKYACQASWDYKELDEDGNDIANRTWTALDKVEKWGKPVVVTYQLKGVGGWDQPGIELVQNPGNDKEYMLTCQAISATDAIKVVRLEDGVIKDYYGNGTVKDGVEVTVNYDGDANIKLPEGKYNFYFDTNASEKKLWIAAATDCGPETITLTTGDNSAVIAANIGNTVNVVIERSFTANDGYYTLCVPFNMDPSVIGKAYSLGTITEHVADEGININLEEETYMLSAGVPYLVLPKENMSELVVENVTIQSDIASGQNVTGKGELNVQIFFEGFYSAPGRTTNGTTEYYVGNNGYLYNGEVEIRGLSGLFTITDKNGDPLKVRARVVTREDADTGLENITNGENTTIKVIENGQLIIIRNGEKFNAQGQKL